MSDTNASARGPKRDPRIESLRKNTQHMTEANSIITQAAAAKTSTSVISRTDPYAKREAAVANRNAALREFGMPDEVAGDHLGRFHNAQEKLGFFAGLRESFASRERVVWERRDAEGRLHNSDGPAAVTNWGTLLFMQEGRMTPGPDGFVAITPRGQAYRGVDQARSKYGELVGLAPDAKTKQVRKTRTSRAPEL